MSHAYTSRAERATLRKRNRPKAPALETRNFIPSRCGYGLQAQVDLETKPKLLLPLLQSNMSWTGIRETGLKSAW